MAEDMMENEDIKNMGDETLLLVSGGKGTKEDHKEYVKKLANAILQVFAKHGEAKMRCVGAASNNNAIKAYIIANGESKKKGQSLVMTASFTTVQIQGEDKTGIIIHVFSE